MSSNIVGRVVTHAHTYQLVTRGSVYKVDSSDIKHMTKVFIREVCLIGIHFRPVPMATRQLQGNSLDGQDFTYR